MPAYSLTWLVVCFLGVAGADDCGVPQQGASTGLVTGPCYHYGARGVCMRLTAAEKGCCYCVGALCWVAWCAVCLLFCCQQQAIWFFGQAFSFLVCTPWWHLVAPQHSPMMLHVAQAGVHILPPTSGTRHARSLSRLTPVDHPQRHRQSTCCHAAATTAPANGSLLRVFLVSDVHTDYPANAAWAARLQQRISPHDGYLLVQHHKQMFVYQSHNTLCCTPHTV